MQLWFEVECGLSNSGARWCDLVGSYKPQRSAVRVDLHHLDQRLGRDGSLQKILDWIRDSGVAPSETLVAFDFDLTLKGAPDPVTGKMKARLCAPSLSPCWWLRVLRTVGFVADLWPRKR